VSVRVRNENIGARASSIGGSVGSMFLQQVQSYFSGHYQCYGHNVPATCDANCRFTSLSVLYPGGTSDSKAFYASQSDNLVEYLPNGFHVISENAYVLSPTLLFPYSGKVKQDSSKDAFNLFLL
jgi:hypothetical protein